MDDRLHERRPAPCERPHAGDELTKCERLGHVIVGADLEADDAVVHRVARGEHQDRRGDFAAAQLAAQIEARPTREHHVEYDHVEGPTQCVSAPLRHCRRARDLHAVLAKPGLEDGGELRIVLDEEETHAENLPRALQRKERKSGARVVILRERQRPKDLATVCRGQHPLARVPVRFAQDDKENRGPCVAARYWTYAPNVTTPVSRPGTTEVFVVLSRKVTVRRSLASFTVLPVPRAVTAVSVTAEMCPSTTLLNAFHAPFALPVPPMALASSTELASMPLALVNGCDTYA